MKTGNTWVCYGRGMIDRDASMEPGHEDREYTGWPSASHPAHRASMEPGHEDREYVCTQHIRVCVGGPQWSPVMKTGNTRLRVRRAARRMGASMEPGHEDREYGA